MNVTPIIMHTPCETEVDHSIDVRDVLAFEVAGHLFSVDVAHVRDVLPMDLADTAEQNERSIRCVLKLRGEIVPCVSLAEHLGIRGDSDAPETEMILTEIEGQHMVFLVDRVVQVCQETFTPLPPTSWMSRVVVTSTAKHAGRSMMMLDFVSIMAEVTDQYEKADGRYNPLGIPREKIKVLVAEDAPNVREAIIDTLSKRGYSQVICFDNGQDALNWLDRQVTPKRPVGEICHIVVSDVEMPMIDGYLLTKRIKEEPRYESLPVILYSPLITPVGAQQGREVGTNLQLAKADLGRLTPAIDKLILQSQREQSADAIRRIESISDHPAETASPSIIPQPEFLKSQNMNRTLI